ncbi:hypothetical protein BGX29_005879 [Mortierella sp. GBA35]|nr:hypothetical protein BGX29_005879 [Mortierella sp. GBA35]
MFCGAPLSYAWSPRIIKVEPNSCLEWFAPAGIKGFIDGTHYFQLMSTQGGTVTEFTQGERYEGWGTGLYSCSGTMEDARKGFIAMNNALQMETLRRRQQGQQGQGQGLAEKTGSDKDSDGKGGQHTSDNNEIAQLDISDLAAVASATNKNKDRTTENAFAEATPLTEDASSNAAPGAEKPVEKRTSIIGAVSSLFCSSKSSSNAFDRLPQSVSKDDLISKTLAEEPENQIDERDGDNNNENEDDEDEDDGNGDEVHEIEDPEAKKAREAKNAERIELDLGSGDLSLGDFGI